MSHVAVTVTEPIATLELQRGKVNAINREVIDELQRHLADLEADSAVKALILTGRGKFFSFGFDVPELYPMSEEECARFLTSFTDLYTRIYGFPKPVIAALNGHAVAGGCMLAIACDRRLMADGTGRISLNEITFGASVFAGSVEMLRACVGHRVAQEILLSGKLYEPAEAQALGLIDRVVPAGALLSSAAEEAQGFASRDPAPFAHMKQLLREPVLEVMREREHKSIREFLAIWYSESTRKQLKGIEIRR